MPPDLYLMRHGQTQWNAVGRMQGRLDSPLTAKGRAQAAHLVRLVADVQGLRISSPQGRALETARIVFGNGFATDDRLAEIDIGDFSGHLDSDLRAAHPAIFAPPRLGWYDRAPGGEGYAGLAARCRTFLADLNGPAIVVTHGITLRMLRLLAMGRDMATFEDMPVEQGAVHVIRRGTHEVWR
ncbi:MAG: histidine phosphatase family protein [Paracoccus sp. (in: a-proteobacteria)]|uniref:histidine phosphatase family protein n=1 Tax=Paracoccus sp. TaxID=267 RepID=UPI0026DF7568|nr:histidine phosphatase family protein [Paracoccus sp. (in: a-proteobacteria)]MDO5612050.1 histidine phosphatase family protein [Paracoccus sp. (in: a-proteobacteria)]